MENMENTKPGSQKLFNFNKEEAKRRLRAASHNILAGIGSLSLITALVATDDSSAFLASALGGILITASLWVKANKDEKKENIKKISEAFGLSEQDVEQVLSESVSKANTKNATALQQPKPQTKDGGMER